MPLLAGARLGPYEIISPLGAGGMGEVYRARDPRIGRDVAIKVLPRELSADAERLRRFEQEARAAGALNHPNLLTLYDVGTSDGGPYLVSELLEGESLRERLPIPLTTAIDCAIQIARGLAAAHDRGIVHRDLKPENIFLVRDGRVKILDFGLAKVAPIGSGAADAATEAATSPGILLGTVGYMSPEQVRGDAVGPAADIFALGAVLFELVAGHPPFRRPTAVETLNAILKEDPPAISAPGDPSTTSLTLRASTIERVVRRCLEKDPANRFSSATDVAFALEDLLQVSSTAVRGAEPGGRASSRRRLATVAAGIAVVAAVMFGISRATREPPSPATAPGAARMTPFLASDAIEKQPAWSPVGDLIAYVSDAAGNDDIWISDASGANPVNLTSSFSGIDAWPAWSADGRTLAFYSVRDGGGIYTMSTLGANIRRLVALPPGVLYTFSLSWARDGSLAYTAFDVKGRKQVYRVQSPDAPTCLTCVVSPVGEGRSGEISPDGNFLAFLSAATGSRADLFVVHLPSRQVQLVATQADRAHWSADSRSLIFISARDGIWDLWRIAVDASGSPIGMPVKLTSALGATTFALAPDGDRILAVKEKRTSHLWALPLRTSPVDLTAGSQMTTGEFRDERGRWAFDGASVFFESDRRGSFDIWKRDLATGALARLTTGDGVEHRPRPSPKGDWVAYDVVEERGEYVHVMRPDGSQSHILDDAWRSTNRVACCAAWSPDGSQLVVFFVQAAVSTLAIVTMDPTSGTATSVRPLQLPGGAPEYGRWSPDGRFIAYEASTDGSWDIWIVDRDGREPRRVTTSAENERSAVWVASPPALYFRKGLGELSRLPLDDQGRADGAPMPWFIPPRRMTVMADSLDVSPTGDRMLVSVSVPSSDIWLVELRNP